MPLRISQTQNSPSGNPPLVVDTIYDYDNNKNIINQSMKVNGVDVSNASFSYDPTGRLLSSTRQSGVFNYSYDTPGRKSSIIRPDGTGVEYSFGQDGSIDSINENSAALPGEGYINRDYNTDAIGRITAFADALSGDSASYSYDILGRLTAAANPAEVSTVLPDENYTYNRLGYRLTSENGRKIDPASREPETVNYSYNSYTADFLVRDDFYTYTYDRNGNTTTRTSLSTGEKTAYTYDVFDRLAGVNKYETADATTPYSVVSYAYDWGGRRIEKNVDGVITRYVYDGQNIAAETDAAGNILAVYHHEPATIDRPVTMERGGQPFYYHYDERGSVIYLTNSGGHIVKKYTYDSFGRVVLEQGDLANIYTYTGRQFDPETGLYHYRARAYDPDTARFLQHDPVFSVNPYSYVKNDPINLVDPMGLYEYSYSRLGHYLYVMQKESPCDKECYDGWCSICPYIRIDCIKGGLCVQYPFWRITEYPVWILSGGCHKTYYFPSRACLDLCGTKTGNERNACYVRCLGGRPPTNPPDNCLLDKLNKGMSIFKAKCACGIKAFGCPPCGKPKDCGNDYGSLEFMSCTFGGSDAQEGIDRRPKPVKGKLDTACWWTCFDPASQAGWSVAMKLADMGVKTVCKNAIPIFGYYSNASTAGKAITCAADTCFIPDKEQ